MIKIKDDEAVSLVGAGQKKSLVDIQRGIFEEAKIERNGALASFGIFLYAN